MKIDNTGIQINTFEEYLYKIQEEYKSTFGENLQTHIQSDIGKEARTVSESLYTSHELLQTLHSQMNPDTSTGVFLKYLVAFNGLTLNAAIKSVVQLEFTAKPTTPAFVETGIIVRDPITKVEFETVSDLTLIAGEVAQVSATAIKTGPVIAVAGSLTEMVNPVLGIASVTNPVMATQGSSEEKDPALRRRRKIKSRATSASHNYSILSAIADLDNVELVRDYSNNTSLTLRGVPPHHLYYIVKGGTDEEIAEAILKSSPAGASYFGGTVVNLTTDPWGSQTIKIGRAVDVNVHLHASIKRNMKIFPKGGETLIKSYLLQYFAGTLTIEGIDIDAPDMGDELLHSAFYTPFNAVPGTSINWLKLGLAANPTESQNILLDLNQDPILLEENITIE